MKWAYLVNVTPNRAIVQAIGDIEDLREQALTDYDCMLVPMTEETWTVGERIWLTKEIKAKSWIA